MVKPILAVVTAISLAIAGVGLADKSRDEGKCPGKCGVGCPGDCGIECPGDCTQSADKATPTKNASSVKTTPVSLRAEGQEGHGHEGDCPGQCQDGCGHGADKAKLKASTGGARAAKTKLVSLKGEGHEAGHKCGHKAGHNGDHPEGHAGCRDKCGRGAGKVETKADATDAAHASLTKSVSLKTESEGEGTCPGHCGFDCPGHCGVDCPGDCIPGNCGGCNGHAKPNATKTSDAATSTTVARAANVQ